MTEALSTLTSVVTSMMGCITGNDFLATLWYSSLVFVGLGILSRLKRVAKR